MSEERLQKIIARAGFASRREAEQLIRSGVVTVNGRVVTELGTKADTVKDHVKVSGRLVTRPEPHRYILLYKPREVMTTLSDPEGRQTVLDFLRGIKERVFPVGRLDYHSEGLILLTNDGELAFKVAHPKHGSSKTYLVKVRGVPEERIIAKLERGITIDGRRTLPCGIARVGTTGRSEEEGNSWFEVTLREGRTHQIRKMFQAMGHPVSKLKRVAIGPIRDGSLQAGQWRELTPREVRILSTDGTPAALPAAAKKPTRTPTRARRAAPSRKAATSKSIKAEPGPARKSPTTPGSSGKAAKAGSAPARKASTPTSKRRTSGTAGKRAPARGR